MTETPKPITAQDVIAETRFTTAVLAELTGLRPETIRAVRFGRRKQPVDKTLIPIADALEKQGQRFLYLAGCVRAMVGRKRTRAKRKRS